MCVVYSIINNAYAEMLNVFIKTVSIIFAGEAGVGFIISPNIKIISLIF